MNAGTPKGPQRRLGRGLSALIPGHDDGPEPESPPSSALQQVPLAQLKATHQPRTHFDPAALQELADSIRTNGVLQPILVRRDGAQFTIIAGERRTRAARLAGLTEVPVIVRETTEAEAYELALVENIQRQDLDPLEEAQAYQHLVQHLGHTQEQIARRVGKDRATVANALRLLKLPPAVQAHIVEGRLTAGHARAILSAPEADQAPLAEVVVAEGLSVRETERRARTLREPPPAEPPSAEPQAPAPEATPTAPPSRGDSPEPPAELSPAERAIEDQLRGALGAPVSLRNREGRGRIEIRFSSLGELERLVDLITSLEGR